MGASPPPPRFQLWRAGVRNWYIESVDILCYASLVSGNLSPPAPSAAPGVEARLASVTPGMATVAAQPAFNFPISHLYRAWFEEEMATIMYVCSLLLNTT